MATQVVSRSRNPKVESVPQATAEAHVELIQADKALLSLRASGHDYCSAIGEVLDNSIQAKANNIRLRLFTEKVVIGTNSKRTEVVDRVAVGDDGEGMDKPILHCSLKLGFSSRYDDRSGMGRFGVGAKLAGISVARRLEIWSRKSRKEPFLYTYIDLDEIANGTMGVIPPPVAKEPPADCRDLVGEVGTLVVWSKTDRLAVRETGKARVASSVEEELVPYVARTFRRFLDSGINIRIGETDVSPHDPLYLMTTTRFHKQKDDEPTANLLVDETFEWPVPLDPSRTAPVRVRISLLPELWRLRAKDTDRPGGTAEARERKIPDNEGISILRADREIFYDYLRDVQPSIAKIKIDRWWGCEISFSPELDECFKVRNVKKGAEPVNGLRDKLKELIFKTAENLRQQIRVTWGKTEAHEHQTEGVHSEAEEIAAKTEVRSPKPRAGQDVSEKERNEKIRDAAKILTQEDPERQESVEDQIRKRPFTILAASWPGSEIFEIEHLGSNVIVKLNMRHPFYQAVYRPLLDRLDAMSADNHTEEERELARLTKVGLDLLILSYAKAEGMLENGGEYYADLRTQWGMSLKNMVQEWKSLA